VSPWQSLGSCVGHWDWHHHVSKHQPPHKHQRPHKRESGRHPDDSVGHDVTHRKGVAYRNEVTRERYGRSAKGAEKRRDFRGFGQGTKYQQAPVTTRRGADVTKGGQAPVTTRQDVPKTTGGQAPVITRQDVPKTKGGQAPVTTYQGPEQRKGAGGFDQKSLDLSKNKSAFGGVGRGSDARMQSDRGFQSRQSMPSKGTGSAGQGNVGRGGGSGGGSKGNVGRPR
jgi:hypothetical protein